LVIKIDDVWFACSLATKNESNAVTINAERFMESPPYWKHAPSAQNWADEDTNSHGQRCPIDRLKLQVQSL
jgi:hypothetical protein